MSKNQNERALNEQMRGPIPMEGIDKGSKRKRLTKEQIWCPRRRTDTILNEMIDKKRSFLAPDKEQKGIAAQKNGRGPRVLVANGYEKKTERAPYVKKQGVGFKNLMKKLPPVVLKEHIKPLLGGLISPKQLAKLNSSENGPKRVRINRKTAYRREDLLDWLGLRPVKFA